MKRSSGTAIFAALALPILSSWAGDPVAIDQLPAPVTEKLSKSFSGPRILSAESEPRNDYIYYFVKIRQGDRVRIVTINEYGAVSGVSDISEKSATE